MAKKPAGAIVLLRRRHGVPAMRGLRVACKAAGEDAFRFGEVKGATFGGYLRVRLDGDRRTELFHPITEVEYLEGRP